MKSAAVVAAIALAFLLPQDPGTDPGALQRAHRLARPDAHHERLQRLVGDWDVELTTSGPSGAMRTDRGRVVAKAILGGRYVLAEYTLAIAPVTVAAVQIFGFDALRQLWTASWRDDLSTWSVDGSGPPADPETGVLVLRGTLADAQDPTGRPFRQVVDLSKPDTVVVTLYDTHQGREFERQRQRWTRR